VETSERDCEVGRPTLLGHMEREARLLPPVCGLRVGLCGNGPSRVTPRLWLYASCGFKLLVLFALAPDRWTSDLFGTARAIRVMLIEGNRSPTARRWAGDSLCFATVKMPVFGWLRN
jgi:hypothetical protein